MSGKLSILTNVIFLSVKIKKMSVSILRKGGISYKKFLHVKHCNIC